jgi:hypothetical protein
MNTIEIDPVIDEPERRRRLYAGRVLLLNRFDRELKIVSHARAMLEAAFPHVDPRLAQYHMPVDEFAGIFARLKPEFIHHPVSWRSIADCLVEAGCNPETTYLDVPRLRISTSDGYLTSGVAYAHHPHRDTWWSSPFQQINWWAPIYEFTSESGMAFHPRYWEQVAVNDSSRFDYYDWNTNQRKNASQHVTSDTRWQPHALEELELEPEVRLVFGPGGAMAFSGAQLHSTVPNTSGRTRYSYDFRTIDIEDVVAGRGAPNVDSAPNGTSLRDFKRLSDGARVSDEIAARFDGRRSDPESLVFQPASAFECRQA